MILQVDDVIRVAALKETYQRWLINISVSLDFGWSDMVRFSDTWIKCPAFPNKRIKGACVEQHFNSSHFLHSDMNMTRPSLNITSAKESPGVIWRKAWGLSLRLWLNLDRHHFSSDLLQTWLLRYYASIVRLAFDQILGSLLGQCLQPALEAGFVSPWADSLHEPGTNTAEVRGINTRSIYTSHVET